MAMPLALPAKFIAPPTIPALSFGAKDRRRAPVQAAEIEQEQRGETAPPRRPVIGEPEAMRKMASITLSTARTSAICRATRACALSPATGRQGIRWSAADHAGEEDHECRSSHLP